VRPEFESLRARQSSLFASVTYAEIVCHRQVDAKLSRIDLGPGRGSAKETPNQRSFFKVEAIRSIASRPNLLLTGYVERQCVDED
jgi:hypothetical protein